MIYLFIYTVVSDGYYLDIPFVANYFITVIRRFPIPLIVMIPVISKTNKY